jgi:hypothetical protein
VHHHSELAATLTGQVARLVNAADAGTLRQVWEIRDELAAWLHDELLPHAYAEEASLYPAAGNLVVGKLIRPRSATHRTVDGGAWSRRGGRSRCAGSSAPRRPWPDRSVACGRREPLRAD